MAGALFGGSNARSQNKNLVEFKAGKMTVKGKMVHADKRKGLVYVYQSSEDQLMHLCWKDRSTGVIEDDLIIFPDDIEYVHVPQCTTGRVYVLKFKSSNRKMFFWMQEAKVEKDEDFCNKLNEFLNHPPTTASTSRTGGSIPMDQLMANIGSESDMQNILQNIQMGGAIDQQQLMRLLGGLGGMGSMSSILGGRSTSSMASTDSNIIPRIPSAISNNSASGIALEGDISSTTLTPVPAPASSTNTNPPARIQLSDLQNILSGLGAIKPETSVQTDLSCGLTSETIFPLLSNEEFQKRLIQFLPESELIPKTITELKATMHSPQFQQALQSFSAALSSGELGPLMAQFGLHEDVIAAANSGDIVALAKALEKSNEKK